MNPTTKKPKNQVSGKLNNPRKLEFLLTLKKLKSFQEHEISSFVGVSRQAINYQRRKAERE